MSDLPSTSRTPPLIGALLLLLLAAPAGALRAQCRPADYDGTRFLEIVRRHADASAMSPPAPSDSAPRGQRARGPVLIANADWCARANAAYRRAATGDLSTLSGLVYVVRSGDDWFVWDPAYRYHSESPFVYMRFDEGWTLERKFELD